MAVNNQEPQAGPSGTQVPFMRDPKIATSVFGLSNYPSLGDPGHPSVKFMFAVRFIPYRADYFSWAKSQDYLQIKAVDRPKIQFKTEKLNQYNKKRLVHTGIEYQDLNLTFYDNPRVWQMFADYSRFYFGDFRYEDQAAWKYDIVSPDFNKSRGMGYNIKQVKPEGQYFFERIELYQLHAGLYTKNVCIHPKIVSFDPLPNDYTDGSTPQEVSMTISYEALLIEAVGNSKDRYAAPANETEPNELPINSSILNTSGNYNPNFGIQNNAPNVVRLTPGEKETLEKNIGLIKQDVDSTILSQNYPEINRRPILTDKSNTFTGTRNRSYYEGYRGDALDGLIKANQDGNLKEVLSNNSTGYGVDRPNSAAQQNIDLVSSLTSQGSTGTPAFGQFQQVDVSSGDVGTPGDNLTLKNTSSYVTNNPINTTSSGASALSSTIGYNAGSSQGQEYNLDQGLFKNVNQSNSGIFDPQTSGPSLNYNSNGGILQQIPNSKTAIPGTEQLLTGAAVLGADLAVRRIFDPKGNSKLQVHDLAYNAALAAGYTNAGGLATQVSNIQYLVQGRNLQPGAVLGSVGGVGSFLNNEGISLTNQNSTNGSKYGVDMFSGRYIDADRNGNPTVNVGALAQRNIQTEIGANSPQSFPRVDGNSFNPRNNVTGNYGSFDNTYRLPNNNGEGSGR